MNYILHLNHILNRFEKDKRLNPVHVSLYMACFRQWNSEKFPRWLPISRSELMKGARINSKSTYHRVIRDLHQWDYLVYKPSQNPRKGSKIRMKKKIVLSVPNQGQLCDSTSPNMGHKCPTDGQLTLYNKQENKKELFQKRKEDYEKVFQEQGIPESEILAFWKWLHKNFTPEEQLSLDWSSLNVCWRKEREMVKGKQGVSHFRDYLQIQKIKRYDQPL